MTDLWIQCEGSAHLCSLNETAWRLVEAQEKIATRKLVDSLEEQDILEEIIETNKPFINKEHLNYHPLLYTPFRYPPLKYGSRFGAKNEPSLWYGSLELNTAMAEKAFYQLNFLRASVAKYDFVEQQLTAFSVPIKTDRAIKIQAQPFADYTHLVSAKNSYETSQSLGSSMRKAEVAAFTYQSARDPNNGINVALFTPKAFLHKKPDTKSFQSWQCIANNNSIEFVRSSSIFTNIKSFSLEQFTIENTLPFPAN